MSTPSAAQVAPPSQATVAQSQVSALTPAPAQAPTPAPRKARRRSTKDPGVAAEPPDLGANTVCLVGRLAAPAEARDLPSGDRVLVWRLIVPRAKPHPTGTVLDTIDCVSFDARIIKRGAGWIKGCWLQADGALRRRFWRSPGGPRSRYEVEVAAARVVAKPSVER